MLEFLIIASAAGWWFGRDLSAEPHFADESAYISQAYYGDLFINGEHDSPAWLEYAGYDLPPLPKYLINLGLRLGRHRRPPRSAARAWYANIDRRFVSASALSDARRPSVLLGAFGCAAIYGLGVLGFDRRVGLLSAGLLAWDPLYRMHARRAMSDVPAEALILASLAVGLWAWRRTWAGRGRPGGWPLAGLAVVAGTFAGLATLAKLNGALACFTLCSWAALFLVLRGPSWRAKAGLMVATLGAGVVAFATFVALDPFLTAHPRSPLDPSVATIARMGLVERVRVVADHRISVSAEAGRQFPSYALRTLPEKVAAVVVQGFGRFGPFGPRHGTDSEVRFQWRQDWGAALWLPIVLSGFALAWSNGGRQFKESRAPTSWAIGVQAGLALAVVTSFLPLAWDRYFLSIQPGAALLGAATIVAGIDLVVGSSVRRRVASPAS